MLFFSASTREVSAIDVTVYMYVVTVVCRVQGPRGDRSHDHSRQAWNVHWKCMSR